MKKKVLVTRRIPDEGLKLLFEHCDVKIIEGPLPPSPDKILKHVPGVSGILSTLTDKIDAKIINRTGDSLKIISNYAVGFDNIDIKVMTAKKILVGHTPGVLTETTADLAFTLLMAAARRLAEGVFYAKSGQWKTWSPTGLLGKDIYRATLGIVGMGRIGQAVACRAGGFQMNVVYCSGSKNTKEFKGAHKMSFEEVLKLSDFVSIHVPLSDGTINLIDKNAFKMMKKDAVLINTARGQIVNTNALYDALKNGDIGYAALDVTDPEPLPASHRLYSLDNCIIVPHTGSATLATRQKMSVIAAKNLLAGIDGKRPEYLANPEVLK